MPYDHPEFRKVLDDNSGGLQEEFTRAMRKLYGGAAGGGNKIRTAR